VFYYIVVNESRGGIESRLTNYADFTITYAQPMSLLPIPLLALFVPFMIRNAAKLAGMKSTSNMNYILI
jgi:hypothetical protein